MAYCTASQVANEAKFANGFSDTSPNQTNPTLSKVNEIIAEVDAKLDGVIGTKYGVPVSDASDLLIVRAISIALVVERVREIQGITAGGQTPEQKWATTSADLARKDLAKILDGTIKLNATLISNTDGTRSFARENGISAVFQKGIRQW